MLDFWNRLPVLLRWILLIPTYLIITLFFGILVNIFNVGWTDSLLFRLWFPPFMAGFGLYLIPVLAPSHEKVIMIGLITLRTLFIPILIFGIVTETNIAEIGSIWDFYGIPLVAEFLVLSVGIYFIKKEY